jgi:hypothetical protein
MQSLYCLEENVFIVRIIRKGECIFFLGGGGGTEKIQRVLMLNWWCVYIVSTVHTEGARG